MKQYLLLGAIGLALSAVPTLSAAQEKTEEEAQAREINIGSHVLKQKGDNEYSYKNEEYYYEKVWEVAGASKDEIYKRVKSWLANLTEAEVSKVNFDEADHNSIGATLDILLSDKINTNIADQRVSFRWQFSFKDGKLRLQGSNYKYAADYDFGTKSRSVSTSYGFTNESYRDVGTYNKPFHDLRPLFKGAMRAAYEDFDAQYLKIVRGMKKMVLSDANNNW